MASVGPFLLLLFISSLFLLSNQQTQETKIQQAKDVGEKIFDVVAKIEPFIALIPKAGPYLSAFIRVIKVFNGDEDKLLNTINSEFEQLNQKLDNQLITLTWHAWASGPYQEAEVNIKSSWKHLKQLIEKCKGSCKKQQYEDLFTKLHTNMVFTPDKLHMLLTAEQPSFITDFSTLFTDQYRCHENTLNAFTGLIDGLMLKGNTLSVFYYSLHGLNKAEELAQMTYEAFLVLTNIHRYCISNPDKYIQKDVYDLINENQDRQQLAKDVMMFLEKTYDRYDWLVVAFITGHSNRPFLFGSLNKHFLSGFLEVTRGAVSVAVAKQVKGNHQRAEEVSQLVEACLGKSVSCKDVIEKLNSCPGNDGPLPDLYTAVHVFRSESHDSAEKEKEKKKKKEEEKEEEKEEAEFTDDQTKSPYIYTGKCKKIGKDGHFRVLIKSDEQLKGEDPCKNDNCGGAERGKCVQLGNIPKGVCECNPRFYGSKCEFSVEEHKEALQKATIKYKTD